MGFISNSMIRNADALRTSQDSSINKEIKVDGNQISWPDNGWYEVQSATLQHGKYNLINHTTGERFENVQVGGEGLGSLMARSSVSSEPTNDGLDATPESPQISIISIGEGTVERPGATGILDDVRGEIEDVNLGILTSGGSENESVVVTISTPDTSAPTSNQPFTNQSFVINSDGVILEDVSVTTPTGMKVEQAGNNDVVVSEPAPVTMTSQPSSGLRNSESETDASYGGDQRVQTMAQEV